MRGDTQTGKTMQSQCDMSQDEADWITLVLSKRSFDKTELKIKVRHYLREHVSQKS